LINLDKKQDEIASVTKVKTETIGEGDEIVELDIDNDVVSDIENEENV
jgi:hypothetical protein